MVWIIIDGVEYPSPTFDALTMEEARTIKRYSGLTLEQVETADKSDPDLMAAICHIVILRANPGLSFAQVEAKVNRIQLAGLDFRLEEDEDRPPVVAQNGNGGSGDSSGLTSDESSAATPATYRPPTGTPV